ncbi:MAG: tetratricopeptide repeat protein [Pseudomonadota bacterium]
MSEIEAASTAGLPPEAAEDWADCVRAFLAHGRETPAHLDRVLKAAPDFALAHAVKGLFLLLLGRSELRAPATEALAGADAAAARCSQPAAARLAAVRFALASYIAGRPSVAATRLAAYLQEAPRDLLIFKLDHAIRFVLGDRRGMLGQSAPAIIAADGADPWHGYLLGCHAFALEENGHYREAEEAGRAGLDRVDDDAWGLHAVAHVFDMTGQAEHGLAWLEARRGAWQHCNNFGGHVWWHLALFHLDRGDLDAVFALYDEKIRVERTDDYRDISNAASLLSRLEIEGANVGDRWEELADLAEARVEPGCVVFADLHYLLALNGAGRREAGDRMVARLAEDAARADHDMHEVAAVAGLPCATGLAAFRCGQYGLAFEHLRAARPALSRIGGSHAQRDVFSRLTIEAGLRAGRWAETEDELRARATRRGAEDGFTARRRAAVARARAAEIAAE